MENGTRFGIAALVLSATGLLYIADREGFGARAYPDPVHGTAVPTVGFGATGGVKMGDTTTPARALARLRADASEFEVALRRCINAPLHQHEFDAYVALAYNVGAGAVCQQQPGRGAPSTIVRRIQAGDYTGACDAILLYKYAGGQDCSAPGNKRCPGIWADRQKLRAMCLGEPLAESGAAP